MCQSTVNEWLISTSYYKTVKQATQAQTEAQTERTTSGWMAPQNMIQKTMFPTIWPALVFGINPEVMLARGIWTIMAQNAGPNQHHTAP